ncbi:ADA32 protein, partial [Todus mexicanus]|nr:ADA32 protein [Todus mexicanus]
VSYVLRIEGRPFTIHLQQHIFLSDDFRIYTSDAEGSLRSDSTPIEGGCHYQGYVEGFPSSAVTLSTCSGLRGLLQFDNVSYGIEPLGYSPGFDHVVYRLSDENTTGSRLRDWMLAMISAFHAVLLRRGNASSALVSSLLVFQYAYMGSDTSAVTRKIIQVFSLVNSMFKPLNVTVVLSSLELWTEENKIPTAANGDELLQQFSQWKAPYLALRPYDAAYLMVYRDRAVLVGAAAPGKACQRNVSGAVAVYQQAMTLESFSVLLAQLLGRSLGINYDISDECRCPGRVCLMTPAARYFRGAKAFSNCSIRDFETFLKHKGGRCLLSSPRLTGLSYRKAVCGNGAVEPGEQCDCGTAEACSKDKCCTKTCQFKPGVKCTSGPCCSECQFKERNSPCRPPADLQCDLAEVCDGSSASCPPDLYVQDGQSCEGDTGYCYQGRCQSPDLQCQQLYGTGSKNAPMACYEEVNSQRDRFGHCGLLPGRGYKPCAWRDLRCGKLICTYPSRAPFPSDDAAVLYVRVRHHLCVSLDY